MKTTAIKISDELVAIRLPTTHLPGELHSVVESTFGLRRRDPAFAQRTFDEWLQLAEQGGGAAE